MSKAMRRIAAVDVGTNSIHLVIATLDPHRGRIRPLHKAKELVRLGSGSGGRDVLSPGAMTRGIAALKRMKRMADAARATVRAIATSAVREASNRDEFIRRVRERCGVTLHVASGAEEARLTYYGALQALPRNPSSALLVDIGGGSTEYLVGRGRQVNYTNSLKMGAVRMSERFFKKGHTTPESVQACRQFVRGSLSAVSRDLRRHKFQRVICTSGTALNLGAMIRRRNGANGDKPLNGYTFKRKDLESLVAVLVAARTPRKRAQIAGLDPERADIIVGGAIILEQTMKVLELRAMTVATMALREGILADELHRLAPRRSAAPGTRAESVRTLARHFQQDGTHTAHVAGLALEIFDNTERLHCLGEEAREWLEAAAMLHEVGYFLSHESPHKHSYYLIRNAELLGFTEDEKEIIACVARYHRKAMPAPQHPEFQRLSAEGRDAVTSLASILRIADGLDRSHSGAVDSVKCRLHGSKLQIRLRGKRGRNVEMELWSARQKADLFEETFGRSVEFVGGGKRA